MAVLLPAGMDRTAVMADLRAAGVQSSVHYPPVHRFSAYHDPAVRLPFTEEFAARELTLPLHPALSDGDVDRVVQSVADSVRRVGRSPVDVSPVVF